nr:MAG TPA: hypothetical protein [Caudoviricetes sp.]
MSRKIFFLFLVLTFWRTYSNVIINDGRGNSWRGSYCKIVCT